MSVSEPLVRLKNVSIRAGGKTIVTGVSFAIHRGEIVTLIGPNGSGKTTTIKSVLGLMPPASGSIDRASGLRIGYVPQKTSIAPNLPLTVRRLMTLTATFPHTELLAALDAVGIAHLIDSAVQSLSGGELQRALLARALLRKPDLLVLDEPLQGVDFTGEIELYALIKSLRARLNCAILLVSHDLHIVMADTDTVICLNGHVCCQGTPQSVALSPEYIQLFGARAAETLAIYRHDHDHRHGADGAVIHNHHDHNHHHAGYHHEHAGQHHG